MILESEIEEIVKNQQEELKRNQGIIRNKEIKIIEGFVTILTGVRRCGKSTIVKQYLDGKKIYYANFESLMYTDFKLQDFIILESVFKKVIGNKGIFFFDEIQNIVGWERYIRELVDKKNKVIITGSNASMLSKDLGTKLTGRHLSQELFPFNYNEFLKITNKTHSLDNFNNYLIKGGFPEYLKNETKDILENLFLDIIYRDVITKNNFRSESELKSLLYYLISNIGNLISFNKLKTLVNINSVNTITDYISAFEDAYLLFTIKKFDYSLKKQLINPKKIYAIDNGIINTNSFKFSSNKGRLLENLVFIELKRKGNNIFYFQNKGECDFLIEEKGKIINAIQVCFKLDIQNKDREINGLYEAMEEFNLKTGLILTYNHEEKLTFKNKKIIIKPVWKWLLEN
jgi:uncharacterized protein